MLESLLKQFGLSENETIIFLCLYDNKKINAARIAKLTTINRATVYTVLRELVKKGLAVEDLAGASMRYYSPMTIKGLNVLIEKQEKELNQKKLLLKEIVQGLENLPTQKPFSIPKIRFVDQLHLKEFLVNESEKWLKSGESIDSTWWGFQDPSLVEEYPEWPKYFFSNFPGKTKLKIITNKKPAETKMKKSYSDRSEVKYISDEKFSATNVVIGDYILMIVTSQHPHYLIEIHDKVMAHNMREMAKKLWEKI